MNNHIHKPPTVVRNLCCKAHVKMAVTSLMAMQTLCADSLEFLIHDDGSLDAGDVEAIMQSVKHSRVVTRREADERVTDELARYPLLVEARAEIPYFLKLLDTVLIDPTDVTCFIDSDVLFLRPFQGFCDLDRHGVRSVFMTDIQSAYGFALRSYWPMGDLRLAKKVNSGFFAVSTADVEIEFVHWILRRCGLECAKFHMGWFEQGIWAAIGHRVGANLFDSSQLELVTEPENLTRRPIAMHFTGRSRSRFDEFAQCAMRSTGVEPGVCERLRSSPASRIHSAGSGLQGYVVAAASVSEVTLV